MRLDKYLKVSRLIKRRTVANEACDAGRVVEVGGCFTGNYIALYAANTNAICKKFVYDVK